MQFSVASVLSALVATAAAVPAGAALQARDPIPAGAYFQVSAIRSGTDIQLASVKAANKGLFLRLADSGASCDKPEASKEGATFYIKDGALFLYAASATPQEIYVDRSGMGQGVIRYTTGAEPTSQNGERTGWALDDTNHLKFNNATLVACPGAANGAWSVWLSGVDKPAGNEGCLGFSAFATQVETPVGCLYTQ